MKYNSLGTASINDFIQSRCSNAQHIHLLYGMTGTELNVNAKNECDKFNAHVYSLLNQIQRPAIET